MNPLVTALLVLGYGLSVPTGFRLRSIMQKQNRLAFTGHQLGVIIAGIAWLIKLSVTMATIHGVWLVAARIVFGVFSKRANKKSAEAVSA